MLVMLLNIICYVIFRYFDIVVVYVLVFAMETHEIIYYPINE